LYQLRRAGIPVRHAVAGRRVIDVEIARRARGLEHRALDLASSASRMRRLVIERGDELELLGESQHRPGEAARPGRERRVALLAVRTAERSVGDVEETLVRNPAADIEAVARGAVIDAVVRGRAR